MPASIMLSPTGAAVTECSGGFTALIFDVNNNPMPAGTKIAVEVSGVTAKVLNDTVVNTLAPNGTAHGITVAGSSCTGLKAGSVTLKVTTPGGLTTIFPAVVVNY